jgi:hypothetical protein
VSNYYKPFGSNARVTWLLKLDSHQHELGHGILLHGRATSWKGKKLFGQQLGERRV